MVIGIAYKHDALLSYICFSEEQCDDFPAKGM